MAPMPNKIGIPSPSPTPSPILVPDDDVAGEVEVAEREAVAVVTDSVVETGKLVLGERL